jgi:pimeloyl-ACP methyl ester carboxylesterase
MPDLHRIITRDGAELHARWWGSGPPVVFIHGWAAQSDIWQYQTASLSDVARCIVYDKRGHGRSSDPGCGFDYDSLADDLARVLEALDVRDAVLVGHSMGPAEIVRYLQRHGSGRVSSVVLISSALPFILKTNDNPGGIDATIFADRRAAWTRDMPNFLAQNARSILLPATSNETVAWIARMGEAASLPALMAMNHTITETDLRPDTAAVSVPTLVIHGDADKSAPLDLTGKRVAAMIAGSELCVYDGAPHALIVTHVSRLNDDLRDWIGRHAGPRTPNPIECVRGRSR